MGSGLRGRFGVGVGLRWLEDGTLAVSEAICCHTSIQI